MIDNTGKINKTFDPRKPDFTLNLSPEFSELEPEIISIIQSYQLERHIKRDETPKPLKINKLVYLDTDFEELWNRIKYKTTYQVNYSTPELIKNCVEAIIVMEKVEPVSVTIKEAELDIELKGIGVNETRVSYKKLSYTGGLPDIIAYLQRETELTRKTIVKILTESGRLAEFAINPQKYMDSIAGIINKELHKLIVDGIKYEKIASQEWSMRLFEDEEVLSYFTNRVDVNKSVYDAIVFDSEVERNFAEALDIREDIKLFVKLPRWFKVETPIGDYNPDWAIVKHNETKIYLVRETKGTKDFEKLRNFEADKIRCGRRHFESLDVDFKVVTKSNEV